MSKTMETQLDDIIILLSYIYNRLEEVREANEVEQLLVKQIVEKAVTRQDEREKPRKGLK